MFAKLVWVRLQSMFVRKRKDNKKNTSGRVLLIVFVLLYCMVTFGFLFGTMFQSMVVPMCITMNMEWLYFTLLAIMALMLGVVGSIMMTQSQIYRATDNELLLSMPIPPAYILGSRMVAIWLWTVMFSGICIIPAAIVYFTSMPFDVIKLVLFIVESFAIPFLSIAICLVMAWLLELITSRMKNKNFFVIVGSLIFFVVYFLGINRLQEAASYLILKGESIASALQTYFYPLYCFGAGISGKDMVSFAIFMVVAIAPFLIMYVIISKTFIQIATTKRGGVKTKYVAKEMKVSSVQNAIIRKEIGRFVSCPIYVINGGFGLLIQVGFAVWVAFKGKEVLLTITDLNITGIAEGALTAFVILAISSLAFMVEVSTSSISIEGKNLWVLKSFPIDASDILDAKAKAHLYISAPFAIVSGLILNIFMPMTLICRVMAFVLPLIMHCFVAYMGLAINLRFPKFDWISEAYAVKQSASVFIATFGGLGVIVLIVVLYLVTASIISSELFLVITAILILLLTIIVRTVLMKSGVRRYNNL